MRNNYGAGGYEGSATNIYDFSPKRKQVNRTKKENTEQKKQAIKTSSDNSYFKRGCSLKKANDEKINPTILAWKIKCVFQVWKERFKLMDRNSIL